VRLLVASSLGAKHEGNTRMQSECRRTIRAASLLLSMFVKSRRIALGSADVLDETCRGGLSHACIICFCFMLIISVRG
jgi:hypothetical protein